MMNAQQLLIEARRLIRDIGFYKGGSYYATDTYDKIAFCSVGALYEANHSENCPRNEFHKAWSALKKFTVGTIPHWNDEPTRTKSEVLEAFTQAIASLEENSQ
jgi:hypothetical protein